ncbi:MAG: Stp1/IreP family PP2C-type Ser/Thr phosphatase [Acidimicrobiales bacterium]
MTLLRSGSATDTGLVRSVNQDLAVESSNLFAVADGMGGHAGGEVAARMAVDTLGVVFGRQPTAGGLSEAVLEANATVWQHSLEHPELRGMGTTLTAVGLVQEDGHDVLALVNVGDSRSYRVHDGQMTLLTTDHSVAEEMVRSGELTEREAAVHPQRHILTRALGVSSDVAVDFWRLHPVRGDRYLLCSDGLTNELDDDQISQVLTTVADPREAADLLVRAARGHGGSDNITVIVVDVVLGEDDAPADAVDEAAPADLTGVVPAVESSNGATTATAAEVAPLAIPEAPTREPSRRERRRARRRQKRTARGRRLVTLRTVIYVVLLGAVVAGAFFVVKWYNTNSYFVGVDNNELVVYQGRIGGFLWFHPVAVDRTGVTTAEVPARYLGALDAGVEETSVTSAKCYVANLQSVEVAQTNPSLQTTQTTTTSVKGCG